MTDFDTANRRVNRPGHPLAFLEVTSPAFSAPLYIVDQKVDWVSNGRTYTACPFGFTVPDDIDGQAARAQLVIPNIGTGIAEELERLGPQDTVTAKLKLADSNSPDSIAYTFPLPFSNVKLTMTKATADCGMDFLMRQQAVRMRYDPATTPGNF